MRIGDVIGTVTLNSVHPSLVGACFKLVVPLSWDNLAGRASEPLEEIAVLDELGAGIGSRIAISEGREAAMPFHPRNQAGRRVQRGDPRLAGLRAVGHIVPRSVLSSW